MVRTKAVVYNTALSSDAFRVDRGVSAASSLTGRGRRSEKLAAAGQDQASFRAHMLLRILLSSLLLSLSLLLLLLCYCA